MLKFDRKPIKLELSEEQFLVIYEMLYHIKLGDLNLFEEAISQLMRDMENSGVEELVNKCKDLCGEPTLVVTFSQEDGLSLQVEEK